MQKNGSNRHQMKHNHDKRSNCCTLKTALPMDLVKKPDLNIGKKL